MTRSVARALALVAFSLAGCDALPLESEAGRYVTYYRSSSARLCGGTVEHVDRQIEVIANAYSMALPDRSSIAYYWLPASSSMDLCGFTRSGSCTIRHLGGSNSPNISVTSDRPYNSHELAHAATMLDRGLPSFLSEGVAGRWQFGPTEPVLDQHVEFIGRASYEHVLALLRERTIPDDDYGTATHLWSWLEAEFGRAKLGELIASLRSGSTAAKVEAEFQRIFGLSLEQAVTAANGTPLLMWDDPGCEMDLPRTVWSEAGLSVGGDAGDCEAEPFVSYSADHAGKMYLVEFPPIAEVYAVEVEPVPGAEVLLYECLGRPRPFEFTRSLTVSAAARVREPAQLLMAGLNVVVVLSPIADDGHVRLPRLEFSRP